MNNQENNPSQSRQTQVVYGDLDVHHDLNVGGMLNARVVRGRNAFCGLFLNQEVLEYHFPHPLVGQWALVINVERSQNNEPAQDEEEEPTLAIGWVFDCETEGTWHDAQYRGGCGVEAILVEKSQREAADTALGGRIDNEEIARLAGDITQGEYNAEEDSIDLKNTNNVLKVRIPAAAFTKDGHVDNVEVTGGNLVITFNEDAGHDNISIPLTQFFNPENYYTKDQVYAKSEVYTKTEINSAIDGEATARLAGDITQGAYNAEEDSIDLKNAANVLKVRIPADLFTKDGHVDNVEVTGGNLVITFNTDAEKEPISIPLTDIFNPALYYTKEQVYTKDEVYTKTEINSAIGGEATAREEADTALGGRVGQNETDIRELGIRIYDEAVARIAGDITQGEYNAERVTIDLKNGQGELVARINAAPFVVDGMVSSVVISSGNLVITFNTDAGKQPISIPLTDIFNPANYYTKEQVDALDYDVITAEEMEAVLESI